jgi:hypothetical protein
MTKTDWISVFLCAIAAALCGVGLSLSAPMFCVSSVFGLIQAIKGKAVAAALINGIFLTLNLYNTFRLFL